jgi:anti-sigma regulatory factor (Ser/Thr protein kinase)
MIVLSAFDPSSGRAGVQSLDFGPKSAEPSLDQLAELAHALGIGKIEFTHDCFESSFSHRWLLLDGRVHYYATVPHHRDSIQPFTRYAGVALCTAYGASSQPLQRLHVGLHELAANALEHGSPLRQEASLRLELVFGLGWIEGWLRDECMPFNPLAMEPRDAREQVAVRARRGYGIALARRLLDQLSYDPAPHCRRFLRSGRLSRRHAPRPPGRARRPLAGQLAG